MACETCSHTMHGIGNRVFWCPRCGTLKDDQLHQPITRPRLVAYVRAFLADVSGDTIASKRVTELARKHGLIESTTREVQT